MSLVRCRPDPAVGPYPRGKRGAESTNWKGGITPERQGLYGTPEWKECVKAVWRRDDATCRRCGLDHRAIPAGDREGRSFAIHHVVGFEAVELRCVVDNLVLLCRPCHSWVHSKENVNEEFIGGPSTWT